ncbi:MAG: hypothetical protein CVU11_03265 [Bacteroidetes bacterium HGW-Bacteroidetes-6]|jgi:hypothetical protein|nr:MAG: hypothetical protein CVU11_03265 [Bacteroidetes bacterium HGW-Bacteroidetes-6]
MANKRGIKGDVNFLTNEVLVDGIMMMSLYQDKGEEIMQYLEKVAVSRNQFISAIQNPTAKRERLLPEDRKKNRVARSKAMKSMINEHFDVFSKSLDATYEFLGTLSGDVK